jgi:hypothetical protein
VAERPAGQQIGDQRGRCYPGDTSSAVAMDWPFTSSVSLLPKLSLQGNLSKAWGSALLIPSRECPSFAHRDDYHDFREQMDLVVQCAVNGSFISL